MEEQWRGDEGTMEEPFCMYPHHNPNEMYIFISHKTTKLLSIVLKHLQRMTDTSIDISGYSCRVMTSYNNTTEIGSRILLTNID